MGVITKERPWFRQFSKHGEGLEAAGTGCDIAAGRTGLAFDLADVMEQGLACELTTPYEVAQHADQVRELSIRRSGDRMEYTLLGEHDRPLLIARALGRRGSQALSFDIFVAGEGDPPVALGPAFRLEHIPKTENWELRSDCCPGCEYRSPGTKWATLEAAPRTLLRVHQERCSVGPGYCMAMDVEMPEEGGTWCPCCSSCAPSPSPRPSLLRLTTRLPKWNSQLNSLTLDFKGRCSQASAKNFQLTAAPDGEGSAADAVLQCGKMDTGDFCLDFRGPLGPVQAFAAALTTASWL